MANQPKYVAGHVHDGDGHHAVFVNPLRVLIVESNDGGWLAQGLEIDYAVHGTSPDDVRERFGRGFIKTIRVNLERFGGIAKLLRLAPAECWKTFLASNEKHEFYCIAMHDVSNEPKQQPLLDAIPFDSLSFRTAHRVASAATA